MANYSFPNLTTAVVGIASTVSRSTEIRYARQYNRVGFTTNLILELDSMEPLSLANVPGDVNVGVLTSGIWYDLTKPQFNATLFGSNSYDGRRIVFADTGYAGLDDDQTFNFIGDFAIEVAFNMTGTPNATFPSALIASWNNFGSSDNKFIIFISSNGGMTLAINGESNDWIYPETISLNTNYHTVVTRRDGVIKWWLNGKLGVEDTYTAAIEPTLGYQIGTYAASSGQAFEGGIDLVRIYRDRSLGDMEVRVLYDQSINRSIISQTLGTKTFDNYQMNVAPARDASNENRPVTGQLYPRFTK
jgi:hypothetical protein